MKIIYLDPVCFSKFSTQDVKSCLDICYSMLNNTLQSLSITNDALKATEAIDSATPIDPELYEKLEFTHPEVVESVVKAILNLLGLDSPEAYKLKVCYDYYNVTGTKIDDMMITFTATRRDLTELQTALELTAGNACSLLYDIFEPGITYENFKVAYEQNPTEALKDFPNYEADAKLEITVAIDRWLRERQMNISTWCKLIDQLSSEYNITTELYMRYPDKFTELFEYISGSPDEDTIKAYADEILPQDFDYIKNVGINPEDYAARLERRADSYGRGQMDIFYAVYEQEPEEYKFLFDNEEYIDLDWCMDVRTAGKITQELRAEILARKADAEDVSVNLNKLNTSAFFANN